MTALRPLDGIRVLELGMWVAGPAVGGILADWGADVIKIEPPGGDPMRRLNLTYSASTEERTPAFDLDNRGKRSLVVDLTTPEGVELVNDILATCDVFVTNTRLKSLERMGLDHRTVLERFPNLVYALTTAYGLEGPAKDLPGYEVSGFWARSGVASRFTPDGQVPPPIAGAFGDHVTALTGVGAVMAGLFARERQQRGQFVTTSLLRAGIYTISGDLATQLALDKLGGVKSRLNARNPLYNSYVAGDGRWFWLLGVEPDRHWPGFVRAIGAPELLDDPRFAGPLERRRHIGDLVPLIDKILAKRTRDEWAEIFDEHDVWWAPVNTIEDLLQDPQVAASGAFTDVRERSGETVRYPSGPIDFPDLPAPVLEGPPAIGEHSAQILDELGLDPERRARLVENGIVQIEP